MRRTINTVILLLAMTATIFGQKVQTKTYKISDYSKIEVKNSIDVELVAGDKEGVAVTCDSRLFPALDIEKNLFGTLEIRFDWDKVKKIVGKRRLKNTIINKERVEINGIKFEGGIKITVFVKQISEISASVASSISWEGSLPTNKLKLETSSAGGIEWSGLLELDELEIKGSSAGDIVGDIKCKTVEVNLSSAADYKGEIEAQNLNADISSAADFKATVNATKANFELGSASDARVDGNIDTCYVSVSTNSNFHGKGIVYKYAEAEASTSASVYMSKSGEIVDKTRKITGVIIQ